MQTDSTPGFVLCHRNVLWGLELYNWWSVEKTADMIIIKNNKVFVSMLNTPSRCAGRGRLVGVCAVRAAAPVMLGTYNMSCCLSELSLATTRPMFHSSGLALNPETLPTSLSSFLLCDFLFAQLILLPLACVSSHHFHPYLSR